MKAHFNKFSLVLLLFCAACYSAEFFPSQDYFVLKRKNPGKVKIVYQYPEGKVREIGRLKIKNFSGDIRSSNFLSFVKREARKKGAQLAWIRRRKLHHITRFNTETKSVRRGGYSRSPTGGVRGTIGIVNIALYVYISNEPTPGSR